MCELQVAVKLRSFLDRIFGVLRALLDAPGIVFWPRRNNLATVAVLCIPALWRCRRKAVLAGDGTYKLPVSVPAYTRYGDIRRSLHEGHVQPDRDLFQCRALYFVQCGAVARSQGVRGDPPSCSVCQLVFIRDWMHYDHFSGVQDDLQAAGAETSRDAPHSIDEAVLFVLVSGDSHAHSFECEHADGLGIDSVQATEVVGVVIRVHRQNTQGLASLEKNLCCQSVQQLGASSRDRDKHRVRPFGQDCLDNFLGGSSAGWVCPMSSQDFAQLRLGGRSAAEQLQLPAQLRAPASSHGVQAQDRYLEPTWTLHRT